MHTRQSNPDRPSNMIDLSQLLSSVNYNATAFHRINNGKSSWPELIGVDGKCAAATIERENSLVEAIIVPEGSSVIENFRCDRVWVWVDKDGIVYIVPVIG